MAIFTIKKHKDNETIALLRRLAAEKQETKRQMREAFATDPEVQMAITRLDRLNGKSRSL